jgi:hypothetical protein
MVRIIGAKVSQNNEGKPFVSLKLQGGVEAVQSQKTGKMYLTAKTCSIATTFDEPTARLYRYRIRWYHRKGICCTLRIHG